MKISILLPYKENFSPTYAGAVSLFVKDTVKLSKYKRNITVYLHASVVASKTLKEEKYDIEDFAHQNLFYYSADQYNYQTKQADRLLRPPSSRPDNRWNIGDIILDIDEDSKWTHFIPIYNYT